MVCASTTNEFNGLKISDIVGVNPSTGQTRLRVRALFISDTHWGTKAADGEVSCQVLTNIESDELYLVGDIIDLTSMKTGWHIDDPTRKAISIVLKKADSVSTNIFYVAGNHEDMIRGKVKVRSQVLEKDVPYRNWYNNRKFLGINFVSSVVHETKDERKVLVDHGDRYNLKARELDELGTMLTKLYYDTMRYPNMFFSTVSNVQSGLLWLLSLAALSDDGKKKKGKKKKKHKHKKDGASPNLMKKLNKIIKKRWGSHDPIVDFMVNNEEHDIVLHGHDHSAGFTHVGGKLVVDDGQLQSEDATGAMELLDGRIVLFRWCDEGLELESEKGERQSFTWDELNMPQCKESPDLAEDKYTKKADRLLRIVFRLTPTKKYKKLRHEILELERFIEQEDVTIPSRELEEANRKLEKLYKKLNKHVAKKMPPNGKAEAAIEARNPIQNLPNLAA